VTLREAVDSFVARGTVDHQFVEIYPKLLDAVEIRIVEYCRTVVVVFDSYLDIPHCQPVKRPVPAVSPSEHES